MLFAITLFSLFCLPLKKIIFRNFEGAPVCALPGVRGLPGSVSGHSQRAQQGKMLLKYHTVKSLANSRDSFTLVLNPFLPT
jgi:hypothetical protein